MAKPVVRFFSHAQMLFSCSGLYALNGLSEHLWGATSFSSFRSLLETHLGYEAFGTAPYAPITRGNQQ